VQGGNGGAAAAQAHYAIAECHEALGNQQEAINALEAYMALARLAAPLAHGRACCKFGSLYYSLGRYPEVRLYLPCLTYCCWRYRVPTPLFPTTRSSCLQAPLNVSAVPACDWP
jgi:hypothetical protein